MKKILLFLALTSPFTLTAQALVVNDTLPQLVIRNTSNYKSPVLNLADFKGKLIIFDFWSTKCGACMKAFPGIDSLQKQFNDKIQIILVTKQDRKTIDSFFARRRNIRLPDVPLITSDTVLSSLFPYRAVPQHVWISPAGVVRYITEGYNLTAKKITAELKGQNLDLKKINSDKATWLANPLDLLQIEKGSGRLQYAGLLASCNRSYSMSTGLTRINGKTIISAHCVSLANLFIMAFSERGKYDFHFKNTILVNTADSQQWFKPIDNDHTDQWQKEYVYSYVMELDTCINANLYHYMQQDLQRFFKVNAKPEKRMVKSLVLVRTGKEDNLKTKGGTPSTNFFKQDNDTFKHLNNLPFHSLFTKLYRTASARFTELPLVDGTGYRGNIDIKLSTASLEEYDIPRLKKELQQFGLDLVEKDSLMTVLVITGK